MTARRRSLLGLAALGALLCVGSASAAVTLTLPGDIVAEAQGPSGAQITYTASADADPPGKPLDISCDGPGGTSGLGTITVTAVFPLGETTVHCFAHDEHGNEAARGEFTVLVQDTTPPVVTPPGNQTVEAAGPSGNVVVYPDASAVDLVDGPLPAACTPPSGSQFPLGTTQVTCTATDSHQNTGTAVFTVRVVDTTPPALTVPNGISVQAVTGDGVPASNPAIAAFLSGASATDVVDPSPAITTDAPGVFHIGVTTVTFRAQDFSGNSSSAASTVTVVAPPTPPPPPPGPPPPAPPAPPPAPPAPKPPAPAPPPAPSPPPSPKPPARDTRPPSNVRALSTRAGNGFVLVTWRAPVEADFDHVRVLRAAVRGPAGSILVYQGRGLRYKDTKVKNGNRYRYVVVSYDRAGNASAGARVVAAPSALLRPQDGASINAPPVLAWAAVPGATYYNLQVYRGPVKVLSVWPRKNGFSLRRSWKYGGRSWRLAAAVYRWYVWPGFGPLRAERYGKALGEHRFKVISP